MTSSPIHLADLETLQAEAARFASTLKPAVDSATLVTLSGELGAGKTSFTQGLATAFGVTEAVTSPTFVLEKIYTLPKNDQGFIQLVHIDAYRLEGSSALNPLGFREAMKDPFTLILLEWPENVSEGLPLPTCAITLTVPENGGRDISYTYA